MIPQPIPSRDEATLEEFCNWVARWGIDARLGRALQTMQANFPTTLSIISGARTTEQQDALRADGRPTAANEVSTHLDCPSATGADLSTGTGVDNGVKIALGLAASLAGLRWGGGSHVDHDTGIPSDWNHVDLGPRRAPA